MTHPLSQQELARLNNIFSKVPKLLQEGIEEGVTDGNYKLLSFNDCTWNEKEGAFIVKIALVANNALNAWMRAGTEALRITPTMDGTEPHRDLHLNLLFSRAVFPGSGEPRSPLKSGAQDVCSKKINSLTDRIIRELKLESVSFEYNRH